MSEEKLIYILLKNLGCEGILITDGNGIVVCIDEEYFMEKWGISSNEVVGKSVFDLDKTNVIKPPLAISVIKSNKPIRLTSAIKGIYKVVGEAFPLTDTDGKIRWIVSFTRNVISERRILQLYDEMLERDYVKNKENININYWIANEGMCTLNQSYSKTLKKIERVSKFNVPILLTGDTGTGKTLLAKKIHNLNGSAGNFIEVNCGSISENLIESELYGYEKGAFTGANKDGKKGLVELADEGTLFLDEIAELPMHLQVKILHFLQDKKIRRVGGTREIEVNCRIISATNKNLATEMREGRFREDLLYRLNLAAFNLPSLSNRPEDILPLSLSILKSLNIKYNKEFIFSFDVTSLFEKYPWPGNIRELENTIHQMILMSDSDILRRDILPSRIVETSSVDEYTECIIQDLMESDNKVDLKKLIDNVEETVISNTWKKYGSSTKVADALNISQTTAARKIRKYVKFGKNNL